MQDSTRRGNFIVAIFYFVFLCDADKMLMIGGDVVVRVRSYYIYIVSTYVVGFTKYNDSSFVKKECHRFRHALCFVSITSLKMYRDTIVAIDHRFDR